MSKTMLLTAFGLGWAVTCGTVFVVLAFGPALRGLRRAPDPHHGPGQGPPRLGGLALFMAFLCLNGLLSMATSQLTAPGMGRSILLGTAAMFLLGLLDDLCPLRARVKLLVQTAVAVAVWAGGIGITEWRSPVSGSCVSLGWWSVVPTVLWILAITNAMNLIDGLDGLAGCLALPLMALIVLTAPAGTGWGFLALGMAGGLLSFLCYNLPPARIYLGDGGAYLLGSQIAFFTLANSQNGRLPHLLVWPMFLLAVPLVDTSLAVLRRWTRGLPVFQPDREHVHHRLLAAGFSPRQVLLLLLGSTLASTALGVWFISGGRGALQVLSGFVLAAE